MPNTFPGKSHVFSDNRSIITLSDAKSKCVYIGNNNNKKLITHYLIDGHVISSSEIKKCDHLLLNKSDKNAIFIEIKGSDLLAAIEQITVTVDKLKDELKEYSIFARIVLTRVIKQSNLKKIYNKSAHPKNGDWFIFLCLL